MKKVFCYVLGFFVYFGSVFLMSFVPCLLIYTGCLLIFPSHFHWETPTGFALILTTIYGFVGYNELLEKIYKVMKKHGIQ